MNRVASTWKILEKPVICNRYLENLENYGGKAKNLEKPGISEIILEKINEFAWKKAVHEVFSFLFILATF